MYTFEKWCLKFSAVEPRKGSKKMLGPNNRWIKERRVIKKRSPRRSELFWLCYWFPVWPCVALWITPQSIKLSPFWPCELIILRLRMNSCPHTNIAELAQTCRRREMETAKESWCSVDQTPCTYMDFHGGASLHATHSFLEVFQDIPITVCNYPSQGSRNSTRHGEK